MASLQPPRPRHNATSVPGTPLVRTNNEFYMTNIIFVRWQRVNTENSLGTVPRSSHVDDSDPVHRSTFFLKEGTSKEDKKAKDKKKKKSLMIY